MTCQVSFEHYVMPSHCMCVIFSHLVSSMSKMYSHRTRGIHVTLRTPSFTRQHPALGWILTKHPGGNGSNCICYFNRIQAIHASPKWRTWASKFRNYLRDSCSSFLKRKKRLPHGCPQDKCTPDEQCSLLLARLAFHIFVAAKRSPNNCTTMKFGANIFCKKKRW